MCKVFILFWIDPIRDHKKFEVWSIHMHFWYWAYCIEITRGAKSSFQNGDCWTATLFYPVSRRSWWFRLNVAIGLTWGIWTLVRGSIGKEIGLPGLDWMFFLKHLRLLPGPRQRSQGPSGRCAVPGYLSVTNRLVIRMTPEAWRLDQLHVNHDTDEKPHSAYYIFLRSLSDPTWHSVIFLWAWSEVPSNNKAYKFTVLSATTNCYNWRCSCDSKCRRHNRTTCT